MKQGEAKKDKENQSAKAKRGPKPETVKIDGTWQEAIKKSLKKKRPKEGWPK